MIKSTREEKVVSASKAILNGLADDGGLYIFDSFPQIDINEVFDYKYQDLATYILDLLFEQCYNEPR